ncbi:MAG: Gfo/Idh/MocA family oxidoreductase [Planctomycetes bacterium]|nr:Gfo/Idh/MocA family oxidoreductase [Planctomycetota bacterium]
MASKKVHLGFLGAGWWATANHMPILTARDDVELTAVCRLGRKELEQVKEKFGFRFATEDAAELVNYPDLDAVVVSSPHTLHFEHARLALERGLHVMCEKPMCTRADHARELVRLANEKRLHLLVPYGWHYKPFIQEAKKWLDDGAIGTVQYALCHMASPIRDLLQHGHFQADKVSGQASDLMFSPDPKTWCDPQIAGGGYGHAQLSHSTGMLFWLTGLIPESVFAMMSAPGAKVDLYDALAVRFEGGAIGTISGAGTVPPLGAAQYQVDLRIFGTEGLLMLDCERARLELKRHDGRQEQWELAADAGNYSCDGPPHNFVDLVLGMTNVNWSPGEAAMRSVCLLDAAYRSAQSGKLEMV